LMKSCINSIPFLWLYDHLLLAFPRIITNPFSFSHIQTRATSRVFLSRIFHNDLSQLVLNRKEEVTRICVRNLEGFDHSNIYIPRRYTIFLRFGVLFQIFGLYMIFLQ
jgi:hypothetical protein